MLDCYRLFCHFGDDIFAILSELNVFLLGVEIYDLEVDYTIFGRLDYLGMREVLHF
jgi:hypothetical protein